MNIFVLGILNEVLSSFSSMSRIDYVNIPKEIAEKRDIVFEKQSTTCNAHKAATEAA